MVSMSTFGCSSPGSDASSVAAIASAFCSPPRAFTGNAAKSTAAIEVTNSMTTKFRSKVGRVTPCAPQPAGPVSSGAHGVTRPTLPSGLQCLVFMRFFCCSSLISIKTYGNDLYTRGPLCNRDAAAVITEHYLVHPLAAAKADRFAARKLRDSVEGRYQFMIDLDVICS